MKKLFFILPALVFISSLHGMEVPNKQHNKEIDSSAIVITMPPYQSALPKMYRHLPEIYYRFCEAGLLPEIIQTIFEFQVDRNEINKELIFLNPTSNYKDMALSFINHTKSLLSEYGHRWLAENIRRTLASKKISICDITQGKPENKYSLLLCITHLQFDSATAVNQARLFLDVAGPQAWELLTIQRNTYKDTPLHYAALKGRVELVKLFLEIAGDHAATLINIRDCNGETAFDVATPSVKKIMQPYLEKK